MDDLSLIDSYEEFLRFQHNYSDRTIKEYMYDLQVYLDFYSPKEVFLSTTKDIHRFIAHLKRERGYAASSIGRKLSALHSFFSFLKIEQIISINTVEDIKRNYRTKKLPSFLLDDEIKKVITYFDERKNDNLQAFQDNVLATLLYYTGMRISELVGLNWSDLLVINSSKVLKIIGKGGRERFIPLEKNSEKILEEWRAKRKKYKTKEMFVSLKTKKRINTRYIQRLFKKMNLELDLSKEVTPHKIRHTFATKLLSTGVSIVAIQKLLGHVDITTTSVYTHITDATLCESVDNLSKF